MNKFKLDKLYIGQKFEYRTISDLYDIDFDAFKAPIDYGIDVIAVPKPCNKDEMPEKRKPAQIMLIQTKSIEIKPDNSDNMLFPSEHGAMPSTKILTIHNIEINDYVKQMNMYCNVSAYLFVYVTIPDDMIGFLFGEDQKKEVVDRVFTFFLPFEDLENLQKKKFLYESTDSTNSDGDKYNMNFRLQGISENRDHSLEVWIQNPKLTKAWAVSSNNFADIYPPKNTNLATGPLNYDPNKLTQVQKN